MQITERTRRELRASEFIFGKIVGAAHAGLEDLPFQLPTRLADGLGLESGPGAGYPASFAPCLEFFRGVWFPRIQLQEGSRILAANCATIIRQKRKVNKGKTLTRDKPLKQNEIRAATAVKQVCVWLSENVLHNFPGDPR